jgi:hypothetical protein
MSIRDANGKFNSGNDFSKGKGRIGLPKDIKDARKVNREKLENCLHEYLHKPLAELVDICKDTAVSSLEAMVANIIIQAATKADHFRMGFILDRLGLTVRKETTDDSTDESMHAKIVEKLNAIEYKNK